MVKRSKKRANRLRNMVTICTLIAIVLSASTYAWFIGMRTVNVSSFDVEIAAVDGLALSLDGQIWSPSVAIDADTFDTYEGNTNTWSGGGLIPMSSVGDMDSTVSRMKLFEKASLTASPGGYRIMSSRVNNMGAAEQDGYVAFDLFVKNLSGTQYIKDLNVLDEEAIYLTTDSEVNVAVGGVQNTGIENSVRVAFTQIGRVAGTVNTQNLITGITCTTDTDVTGICRKAQIWEPNDKNHVVNAISWYNTSCKARTGSDVTDPDSFSGSCMPVIDGVTYPTYAVSKAIASSDSIDVYDGAEYNTYVNPSPTAPLVANPSFTDSDKQLRGTSRPTFMTLAPNSITKVRIYIYIEGQDVDNYDFASIGKRIAVKFGFTKERYTEDDIQYNGPDLNEGDGPLAGDLTVPVITLTGANPFTLDLGTEYVEPGVTAHDNIDGDIALEDIVITGTVNKDVEGTYTIVYKATDTAGNVGVKTRTVIVRNAG
ncbi:MAG: DUF5011 domain-containing protein [Ignavibacteriales bacterium]